MGAFDEGFTGQPVQRADLGGRLDFLGINYYARVVAQGIDGSFLPALSPLLTFNPLTLDFDYAYPKGIYDVLMWAWARYRLPMIITETGVEDAQDAGLAPAWVVQTLSWLKRAIDAGATVEGYFYWSLMDNYEWNHGMDVRMGLYAVDKDDPQKVRRARQAVTTLGRVAAGGAIPADLAAKYPIPGK
jgi:beta-glucosidase/6-phospho-beta-glucosidase/beta-galactosidase